jgi:hypothetical protein
MPIEYKKETWRTLGRLSWPPPWLHGHLLPPSITINSEETCKPDAYEEPLISSKYSQNSKFPYNTSGQIKSNQIKHADFLTTE